MQEFQHLGKHSTEPVKKDGLEVFSAPPNTKSVTLFSDELTSFCPVTNQPDFYSITIDYEPNGFCLETKSLKLYLQSFRSVPSFCEVLAHDICNDLYEVLSPVSISVHLSQQKRGGIELSVYAEKKEEDSEIAPSLVSNTVSIFEKLHSDNYPFPR